MTITIALMLAGTALGFIAIMLSMLWQHMDARADYTILRAQEQARRLMQEGYRQSDISEAEAKALKYKKWCNIIRAAGLFALYGGLALILLSLMLWAIGGMQ